MAQKHNIRSNNSAEINENDEDENATGKTKVRGKSITTETLTDFAKLKKLFVSPVTMLDEPVKMNTSTHRLLLQVTADHLVHVKSSL